MDLIGRLDRSAFGRASSHSLFFNARSTKSSAKKIKQKTLKKKEFLPYVGELQGLNEIQELSTCTDIIFFSKCSIKMC